VNFLTNRKVQLPTGWFRLFQEGLWIVVGQAMTMLGALVGVRLLTGVLDPAQYGELALGITVATLINQLLLGPLGQGVQRFYAPSLETGELNAYLRSVRQLLLKAAVAIVVLGVVATLGLTALGQVYWVPMVLMALAFATTSGCNGILSGMQGAARQRAVVAMHQALESWMRFLLAVGVVGWLGNQSHWAMLGYLLSSILVLISQWYCFTKAIPAGGFAVSDRATVAHWRQQVWHFSWPFMTFGLFTWAQVVSDRWALGIFADTQQVGMYSVLFQLGYYPISLLTGMAVQFIAPILFKWAGDAKDAQRNATVSRFSQRLAMLAIGVTLLFFALSLLLHPLIFQVFVAPEYRSISYLFPWMVLSGGVYAAGQTLSLDLLSQMKTRDIIPVKTITAIVGVGLNFGATAKYGLPGTIAANAMFSVIYCLWMALLLVPKWRQASTVPSLDKDADVT
jgi:O-antigen/teichoic acid export membrane protein